MSNIKKTFEITLDKAKKWYRKGGDLKEIALSVFSEDELKEKKPQKAYGIILENFATNYPLYSVVWSNEGTDCLPNIIVSKPRYETRQGWDGAVRVIVFDAYRISIYSNKIYKTYIRIDESNNSADFNTGKISSFTHSIPFDYNDYKTKTKEELSKSVKRMVERNEEMRKDIKGNESAITSYEKAINNFDKRFNKLVEQAKAHSYEEK